MTAPAPISAWPTGDAIVAGSRAKAASARKGAAQFVANLYEIVMDPGTDDVVHWFVPSGQGLPEDGVPNCFVVEDIDAFCKACLPRLSSSSSFCSFVRQLNGYGFSKADPKHCAFMHLNFRKGHADGLRDIQRRPSSKRRQAAAAASAHTGPVQLLTTSGAPMQLPAKPPQPHVSRTARRAAAAAAAAPTVAASTPTSRIVAAPITTAAAPASAHTPPGSLSPASGSASVMSAGSHSTTAAASSPASATAQPAFSAALRSLMIDALTTIKSISSTVAANETLRQSLAARGITGADAAALLPPVGSQIQESVELFVQRQAPRMFAPGATDVGKAMDLLMSTVETAHSAGTAAATAAAPAPMTTSATAAAAAAAPAAQVTAAAAQALVAAPAPTVAAAASTPTFVPAQTGASKHLQMGADEYSVASPSMVELMGQDPGSSSSQTASIIAPAAGYDMVGIKTEDASYAPMLSRTSELSDLDFSGMLEDLAASLATTPSAPLQY